MRCPGTCLRETVKLTWKHLWPRVYSVFSELLPYRPWFYTKKGETLIYSYFEKGCRKKYTRQSQKVLWVVLSSLFFEKIWKNGKRGHAVCLRMLKEGSKSGVDSYSVRNSVLIISQITFRDFRAHIFSDNLSRNSCIWPAHHGYDKIYLYGPSQRLSPF